MPSSNARTATLFAALTATSVAFVAPASALDFNNPKDKRVYCQVYATQALSDVHAIQARDARRRKPEQQIERPGADQEADDSSGGRQHEALGEHLPHEA